MELRTRAGCVRREHLRERECRRTRIWTTRREHRQVEHLGVVERRGSIEQPTALQQDRRGDAACTKKYAISSDRAGLSTRTLDDIDTHTCGLRCNPGRKGIDDRKTVRGDECVDCRASVEDDALRAAIQAQATGDAALSVRCGEVATGADEHIRTRQLAVECRADTTRHRLLPRKRDWPRKARRERVVVPLVRDPCEQRGIGVAHVTCRIAPRGKVRCREDLDVRSPDGRESAWCAGDRQRSVDIEVRTTDDGVLVHRRAAKTRLAGESGLGAQPGVDDLTGPLAKWRKHRRLATVADEAK